MPIVVKAMVPTTAEPGITIRSEPAISVDRVSIGEVSQMELLGQTELQELVFKQSVVTEQRRTERKERPELVPV